MSRAFRGCLALLGLLAVSCSLTRSLDEYSSEYGRPIDGGDTATPLVDAAVTDDAAMSDDAGILAVDAGGDAGDGCSGTPVILEPADGATVGATMRVRVTAPACIQKMIIYIDSTAALHVDGGAADQSFPVTVAKHQVNVNGWAGTNIAHTSPIISVTRTQ